MAIGGSMNRVKIMRNFSPLKLWKQNNPNFNKRSKKKLNQMTTIERAIEEYDLKKEAITRKQQIALRGAIEWRVVCFLLK
jgi:hypothetical protein